MKKICEKFSNQLSIFRLIRMIYKNIKLPNRPIDDCGFEEVEWMMCMSWSSDDDRRLMSFIDILWGFEVTGGLDQYESLIVTNVSSFNRS